MKIPFLDLKQQYKSIKEEIDPAIQNVIDNTAFILGKPVSDFEQEFANAHNVKHCIGVSSGTDGNHLVLWTLGIGAGNEVIVPANTFIATAEGVTLCGAKPVFVDCCSDNYNIDPDKIEGLINSKTKAIVAVHLYGQPADMDALREIAKEHNLILVEDAAQAHLSEYKGKKVGGLCDAASFSFYPGKNLGAYGEAGAVTTNEDVLAKKLKMYREHGQSEKYHHETFGHNYRMDGIQGAVLGVKLKHLSEWTDKRRAVAEKYKDLLDGVGDIVLPAEMPYSKHVYHLFVIKTKCRDELQNYLNENEISNGLHYPIPLHLQNSYKHLGYKKGDFPNTEDLANNCLSLPMFPELSEEQINYVVNKIKDFYKRK
ncbi:DegT/DnrJ/EryC1/StrS family aminotransferase [Bacteroidota bacterium]